MNEKLRQVLDHEIERSVTWSSSAIRSEQERNLSYYLGSPMGNEVEGRSQVVSWDVFEVVESALPSFLEPLFGGDNIAEFQRQRGPILRTRPRTCASPRLGRGRDRRRGRGQRPRTGVSFHEKLSA